MLFLNILLEQQEKHEYNQVPGFDEVQSGMDTSFWVKLILFFL